MILTFLRSFANLLRLPFFPLWLLMRPLARPRPDWVVVHLRSRITEVAAPRHAILRMIPWLSAAAPSSLAGLTRLAKHAAKDPKLAGVVFVVPPLQAGWALVQGLCDVMEKLRAAGKQVAVYLPEGGMNRELLVCGSADRVFVSPEAAFVALGVSAEARYLKPLLDKVGVEVSSFARAEYKTAVEPLTRDSMSEAQREQVGALLDDVDKTLRDALRTRLDDEAVTALFERVFLRGEAIVESGVADAVSYEDELPNRLASAGKRAVLAPAERYLAFHEARFFARVLRRPYIAVVPVRGPIGGGPRGQSAVAALRLARRDRLVRGVVLLVDSPGGSANGSDLIRREVQRLTEKKPVVALFSNVAASGGYYVATHASAIVARPLTVTGSIGVVSARLLAADLLGRLGIRTETVRKAPHADMLSPARPLEESERAILEREVGVYYDAFVELVAEGRGRSASEIEPLARGRVWTGAAAHARGLVDRLGGLDEAIEEVEIRAGVRGLEPRLLVPRRVDVPPPDPPPMPAMLRRLMPEWAVPLGLLGREPVLYYALVPRIQ